MYIIEEDLLLDVEGERRRIDEIVNKCFHFFGDSEYNQKQEMFGQCLISICDGLNRRLSFERRRLA